MSHGNKEPHLRSSTVVALAPRPPQPSVFMRLRAVFMRLRATFNGVDATPSQKISTQAQTGLVDRNTRTHGRGDGQLP
jgi:hypothetical protein